MSKKIKVLIADDSPFIRNMIKESLKDTHVEIIESTSAKKAVDLFADKRPEIVIMDIIFPGDESGLEALAEIKKIDNDIKIIVCSSVIEEENVEKQIAKLDVQYSIKKPFKTDDLINILNKLADI